MTAIKLREEMMLRAVREARKNLTTMEGGAFGACIVRGDTVVAVARNTVLKHDATCHAEVNAIRKASRKLGTYDLSECHIYSTTEPCPMCFSAIHWARMPLIAYGTNIADVKRLGFNELTISNRRMKSLGGSSVEIVSGCLRNECLLLLAEWEGSKNRTVY